MTTTTTAPATTTVNAALLRETLDDIRAHPDTWEQKVFRHCGSAGCFAWRAGMIAGGIPHPEPTEASFAREDGDPAEECQADGRDGREYIHVADRARRVLGLDPHQAMALFAGHNSLSDLEQIAALLITGQSLAGPLA